MNKQRRTISTDFTMTKEDVEDFEKATKCHIRGKEYVERKMERRSRS